jgi:hypothetical protein
MHNFLSFSIGEAVQIAVCSSTATSALLRLLTMALFYLGHLQVPIGDGMTICRKLVDT